MPLSWFQKLRTAKGDRPFAENLGRFGFITDKFNLPGVQSINQTGLPIGFTVGTNKGDERDFVGLTCAACHSGIIRHGGKSYMIEGAPSMLDFDKFLSELVDAMATTDSDTTRWDAFSNGMVSREGFRKVLAQLGTRRKVNTPSKEAGPAGFGRVDAFGHIFNQVVVQHLGNDPDKDGKPPDAPASYPALWDIAQHVFVQWNYSAPNLGVGAQALGSKIRNIGEVLGVFGWVEIKRTPTGLQYDSSANVENLQKIESWLQDLRSPAWPFNGEGEKIDQKKKKDGGIVYNDAGCVRCHKLVDPKHPPSPFPAIPVEISTVGTEDDLDRNIEERTAPTGPLRGVVQGTSVGGLFRSPFDPLHLVTFGSRAEVSKLTAHIALNILPEADQVQAEVLGLTTRFLLGSRGSYKARPLNGVWATAPYLHNGSIPNLMQLLTPSKDRMPRFCVGDREFDLQNVGFRTYEDNLTNAGDCPPGLTLVDTQKNGSRNFGHEYGVNLSLGDKSNLIEFLKSL